MELKNLHIIQVVSHRVLSGKHKDIKGDGALKIHPVIAETGEEAIEKVKKWYKENKPNFAIRIVDSEDIIF